MQSEQDQIDNDLLGDQEKEFDERKDSQPIRKNADQNRSYQHRPSFSANTRICNEFERTGACLLSSEGGYVLISNTKSNTKSHGVK